MLYSIPMVSTRPWSIIIRRVWKTSSLRPIQPFLTSRRAAYATAVAKARAPTTKSKATQPKKDASAKKTAKKPAATKQKGKLVAAKKSAPKKKPKPKRRVLTEYAKARLEKKKAAEKKRSLKEAALLSEPTKLPISVWMAYYQEQPRTSGNSLAEATRAAARGYKTLPPAEVERFNQLVKHNREVNELAYKKWVSSFTPEEIRNANSARKALRRLEREKKPGKLALQYRAIQDDRHPKHPTTSFFFYLRDKWASGDFKGVPVPDSARLAKAEFLALSPAEKKVYEDKSKASYLRYRSEMDTVFQ